MKIVDWLSGKIQTIKGWLFGGNPDAPQADEIKAEIDTISRTDEQPQQEPNPAGSVQEAEINPPKLTEVMKPYDKMCDLVGRVLDANGFLSKGVLNRVVKKSYLDASMQFDDGLFDRALQNRSRGYNRVPPQSKRADGDNRVNDSVYYSEKWLLDFGDTDVIRCIKTQIASKIRNLREEFGPLLNDPEQLKRIMLTECDEFYGVISNENYSDMMLIDLGEPPFDDLTMEI